MGSSGLLLCIWRPAGEVLTTGLARNAALQLDLIKLAGLCWVKQRRLKLCVLLGATASTCWRTDEQPWSFSNSFFVGQRSAPVIAFAILLRGDDLQSRVIGQDECNTSSHPGCL